MAPFPNRVYSEQQDSMFSPFAPLAALGAVGAAGAGIFALNTSDTLKSFLARRTFGLKRFRDVNALDVVQQSQFKVMDGDAVRRVINSNAGTIATTGSAGTYQRYVAMMSVDKMKKKIISGISEVITDLTSIRHVLAGMPPTELTMAVDLAMHDITTGKRDALIDALRELSIQAKKVEFDPELSRFSGMLIQVTGKMQKAQNLYAGGFQEVVTRARAYGALTEETFQTIISGSPTKLRGYSRFSSAVSDMDPMPGATGGKRNKAAINRWNEANMDRSIKISRQFREYPRRQMTLGMNRQRARIKTGALRRYPVKGGVTARFGFTGDLGDIDKVIMAAQEDFSVGIYPQHRAYLNAMKGATGFADDVVSSAEIKPMLKKLADGISKELNIDADKIKFYARGSDIICEFKPFVGKGTATQTVRIPIHYEEAGLMSLYGHNQIMAAPKRMRMDPHNRRFMFSSLQEDAVEQITRSQTGILARYKQLRNKGLSASTANIGLQLRITKMLSGMKDDMIDVTRDSPLRIWSQTSSSAMDVDETTIKQLYGRIVNDLTKVDQNKLRMEPEQKHALNAVKRSIEKHESAIKKINQGYGQVAQIDRLNKVLMRNVMEVTALTYRNNTYLMSEIRKQYKGLFDVNIFGVSSDRLMSRYAFSMINEKELFGSPSSSPIRMSKAMLALANAPQADDYSYSSKFGRMRTRALRRSIRHIKLVDDKKTMQWYNTIKTTTFGQNYLDKIAQASGTGVTPSKIHTSANVKVLITDAVGAAEGGITVNEDIPFLFAAKWPTERVKIDKHTIDDIFTKSVVDHDFKKLLDKAKEGPDNIIDLTQNKALRQRVTHKLKKHIKGLHKGPFFDVNFIALKYRGGSFTAEYNVVAPSGIGAKMWLDDEFKGTVQSIISRREMAKIAADSMGVTANTDPGEAKFLRSVYSNVAAIAPLKSFDRGRTAGITLSVMDAVIESAVIRIDKAMGPGRRGGNINKSDTKLIIKAIMDAFDDTGGLGNTFELKDKISLQGKDLNIHYPNKSIQDLTSITSLQRSGLDNSKVLSGALVAGSPADRSAARDRLTGKIRAVTREIAKKRNPNIEKGEVTKLAQRVIDEVLHMKEDGTVAMLVSKNIKISAITPGEAMRVASGKFQTAMVGGYKEGTVIGLAEQMVLRMTGLDVLADRAQVLRRMGTGYVGDYMAMQAAMLDPGYADEYYQRFGRSRFRNMKPGTSKRELLTPDYIRKMKDAIKTEEGQVDFRTLFKNRFLITQQDLGDATASMLGREQVGLQNAIDNIGEMIDDKVIHKMNLEQMSGMMKNQLKELNTLSSVLTMEQYDAYKTMTQKYKFLLLDEKNPMRIIGPDVELSSVPLPGIVEAPFNLKPDEVGTINESYDVFFVKQKTKRLGKEVGEERLAILNRPHQSALRLMTAYAAGADKGVVQKLASDYYEAVQQHTQSMNRKLLSPRMSGSFQQRPYVFDRTLNLENLGKKYQVLSGKGDSPIAQKAMRSIFQSSDKYSNLATNKPWQPGLGEVWMDKSMFVKTLQSQAHGSESALPEIHKIANEIMENQRVYMSYGIRYPTISLNAISPLRVRLYDAKLIENENFIANVESNYGKGMVDRLRMKDYRKGMFMNLVDVDYFHGDVDGDSYNIIMAHYKNEFNENNKALANMIKGQSFRYEMKDGTINVLENSGDKGKWFMQHFKDFIDDPDVSKTMKIDMRKHLRNSTISIDQYVSKLSQSMPAAEKRSLKAEIMNIMGAKSWSELKQKGTALQMIKPGSNDSVSMFDELIKAKEKRRTAIAGLGDHVGQYLGIDSQRDMDDLIATVKTTSKQTGMNIDSKEIEEVVKSTHMLSKQKGKMDPRILDLKTSTMLNWRSHATLKAGTGAVYNFVHNVMWDTSAAVFGVESAKTRGIAQWLWNVQQANISSKHMMPAVAPDFVNQLRIILNETRDKDKIRTAYQKLETGNVDIKVNTLFEEKIDETLKMAKEGSADEVQLIAIRDRMRAKSAAAGVKESRIMPVQDYHDYMAMLADKKRGYAKVFSGSNEVTALFLEARDSSKKVIQQIRAQGETMRDVKLLASHVHERGISTSAAGAMTSKVIASGADQRFQGILKGLFGGKTAGMSYMDQVVHGAYEDPISAIMRPASRSLFRRPEPAKSIADSMVRKMANIVEGTNLKRHISTKGIQTGMGLSMLGIAAMGFIGMSAAAAGGQPWLGPQPGYGGEYYERRRRKDEEHIANINTTGRTKLKYLDMISGPNYKRPKTARIYTDPQKKRYGTVSQVLESLHALRNMGIQYETPRPRVLGATQMHTSPTLAAYGGF